MNRDSGLYALRKQIDNKLRHINQPIITTKITGTKTLCNRDRNENKMCSFKRAPFIHSFIHSFLHVPLGFSSSSPRSHEIQPKGNHLINDLCWFHLFFMFSFCRDAFIHRVLYIIHRCQPSGGCPKSQTKQNILTHKNEITKSRDR